MDASRKLGFSAKQTMQVAQRLYEGVDIGGETVGLITYMRTDGVTIVPEAINAIRGMIAREYSQQATSRRSSASTRPRPRTRRKRTKRSARPIPRAARRMSPAISTRTRPRLYELIWKRTRREPDGLRRARADDAPTSRSRAATARPTGCAPPAPIISFDGFLKVYEEGRDDRVRVVDKGKDDPPKTTTTAAACRRSPRATASPTSEIDADQHFTQPPPRFSEATLVKRMEELGIGRPSTYASTHGRAASTATTSRSTRSAWSPRTRAVSSPPSSKASSRRYVEFDFTADLEEKLDLISDDKLDWKEVLRDFWRDFTGAVDEIKDLRVGDVLEALNEMLGPHIFPDKGDGSDPRACPKCGTGRLSLKISGKNGAFIGCGNYPDCHFTRQLATRRRRRRRRRRQDARLRSRHRSCR